MKKKINFEKEKYFSNIKTTKFSSKTDKKFHSCAEYIHDRDERRRKKRVYVHL